MLDGSGIGVGGVIKLAVKPMLAVGVGCVRVTLNRAGKVCPVGMLPNVPAVQFPTTSMLRKPAGLGFTVIEVLAKVPKSVLVKVRLVLLVVLNVSGAKICVPRPAKTPEFWPVVTGMESVKDVDVARLPVLDVRVPMFVKTWVPVGLACALVARARQIATADSTETITGRIVDLH
jgi:hypothetical protein